jgi:hypothetical protein
MTFRIVDHAAIALTAHSRSLGYCVRYHITVPRQRCDGTGVTGQLDLTRLPMPGNYLTSPTSGASRPLFPAWLTEATCDRAQIELALLLMDHAPNTHRQHTGTEQRVLRIRQLSDAILSAVVEPEHPMTASPSPAWY